MIASPQSAPSPKCPVCGAPTLSAMAEALPFCSVRCQQADLRRWLGEEYGLPHEREEPEDYAEDDLDMSQGAH